MTLIYLFLIFLWGNSSLAHSPGGNANANACVVYTVVEQVFYVNTYVASNTSLSWGCESTFIVTNAPTFLALTFTTSTTLNPPSESTLIVKPTTAALPAPTTHLADYEITSTCIGLDCDSDIRETRKTELSPVSVQETALTKLSDPTSTLSPLTQIWSSDVYTKTESPKGISVQVSTPLPSATGSLEQIILTVRPLRTIGIEKRDQTYVQADGQLTSDCSSASSFTLSGGQLYNSNSDPPQFYYAPPYVDRASFTASAMDNIPPGSTTLGFSVDAENQLHWNLNFTSLLDVRFALEDQDTLIAIFNGYLPPESIEVTLQVSLVEYGCPEDSASSTTIAVPAVTSLSPDPLSTSLPVVTKSEGSIVPAESSVIVTDVLLELSSIFGIATETSSDYFIATTSLRSDIGVTVTADETLFPSSSSLVASTRSAIPSTIPSSSCPATCFKLAVSSPDLSTKYLYDQYQSEDEFLSFTSNYTLGQVFSLGVIEVPSLTTVLGAAATPQSNNLQFTMIDFNGNTVLMHAEQDQFDAGNQQVWFATKGLFDDREFLPIIGTVDTSDCTLDLSLPFNGADVLQDCSILAEGNPEDDLTRDPTIYLLLPENDLGCTTIQLEMIQDSCPSFPAPDSSSMVETSTILEPSSSSSVILSTESPTPSSLEVPSTIISALETPSSISSSSSEIATSLTSNLEESLSTTAASLSSDIYIAALTTDFAVPSIEAMTTVSSEQATETILSSSSELLQNSSISTSTFVIQISEVPAASSTFIPSDIETATTTTSSSDLIPSSTSCRVPPPTFAPATTTSECCEWYIVQPGEDCAVVEDKNSISDSQFRKLNPGIDENCYNLFSGIAYCVAPNSEEFTPTQVSSVVATPSPTTVETTSISNGNPLCTEASGFNNGGFENSPIEINPWTLTSENYTFPFLVSGEAYVYEGENALLIYKDAPQNTIPWVLAQDTTPCALVSYVLTFWIRSSGERNPTTCPISVCFGVDCQDITEIHDYDYIYTQYQVSSGILNSLDSEGMSVSIQTDGCGQSILLDDISFDITDSQPPPQVIPPTVDCSAGVEGISCEAIPGCYWGFYYERCFAE